MDGKLEAFTLWMRENGVWWDESALTFASGSDVCEGYGVVAAKDIATGTKVASIQKKAVLSVRSSAIASLLEAQDLSGTQGLTIALLHEMSLGDESRWAQYIATMPTSVTMPATWTADETAWLQGTCAQRQTITAADRLQKEFSDTYTPLVRDNETLFNGKVRTFAAYQLAAGLVSSRAFRVDDESEDSEMLPLADMFNHRSGGEHVHIEDDITGDGSNASGAANAEERLDIRTVQDVQKGEEVFNTFGDLSAADLLCKYGFVDLDAKGRARGEAETCRISLSLIVQVAKSHSKVGHKEIDKRVQELIRQRGDVFLGDDVMVVDIDEVASAEQTIQSGENTTEGTDKTIKLDQNRTDTTGKEGQNGTDKAFEPDQTDPDVANQDSKISAGKAGANESEIHGEVLYSVVGDGSFNYHLMLMLYVLCVKDKNLVRRWLSDANGLHMVEDMNAITMEEILELEGVSETLQNIVVARLKEYPDGKLEEEQAQIAGLVKNLASLSDSDRNKLYALVVRVEEKDALRKAYHSIFDTSET